MNWVCSPTVFYRWQKELRGGWLGRRSQPTIPSSRNGQLPGQKDPDEGRGAGRAEGGAVAPKKTLGNSGRERHCRWTMRGFWWRATSEHYNKVRLNSAIAYITPKNMPAGRQQELHVSRSFEKWRYTPLLTALSVDFKLN